jgi:predicted ATP-grasp superfamily ATP-dependent carboligase
MLTIEKAQQVVDEVREVCRRHGVALLGACFDEGVAGEIEIIDSDSAVGPGGARMNQAQELGFHGATLYVDGIGEVPGA